MRLVSKYALALASLGLLTACAGDGGEVLAEDTSAQPSASPTPVGPNPEPGSLPAFEPENYTYVYSVSCFCPGIGTIETEVVEGEIEASRYLKINGAGPRGGEVPDFFQLTIQDMLDEANQSPQADLRVDWPDGQSYPNSISIDRIPQAVDDEVGYVIESVELTGD